MAKIGQKESDKSKETETLELKLTKEQAKSLQTVLGGLDVYLVGHIVKDSMDENEVNKNIIYIYNRLVDMEKGEK